MGMSVGDTGGRGGRGHRRRGRHHKLMSEINVTPFVDVMLVLLVIFMVAAPLLAMGIPLELPQVRSQQINADTQPISISIDQRGRVFIQDTEIPIEEVVPKLVAISQTGYEERIHVHGDRRTLYGDVMSVLGRISQAGFRNIALRTASEDEPSIRLKQEN